ncbi:MAG: 50S ribosomal protein L18 [Candidatus Portnoybacteria bacterium CG03_land_8_20_14_0_80_41_10]|uniref:Large ribosomal subunit protein uL18 n=1 Tax=Candidatus Portnoybacteria bacterium CG03_land_8_20_14_0_80_41_10 TaxID=1974808 RepID=A0A2M7BUP6_9BACT|nr:MAG: 50S ribosomal protein L18 [Candidatus Portnoybacteria bacterium CG03_land_8_20_14_0_80_41_10]
MQSKQVKLYRRHKRIRAKLKGTRQCPRLSVFRSNQHIYLQLVDDEQGKTLVGSSDLEVKKKKLSKLAKAQEAGKIIAEKALGKKIKKIVFDRGGYKYHGRIKAVAEGARKGGLVF